MRWHAVSALHAAPNLVGSFADFTPHRIAVWLSSVQIRLCDWT